MDVYRGEMGMGLSDGDSAGVTPIDKPRAPRFRFGRGLN
jgi:hypothetical protein